MKENKTRIIVWGIIWIIFIIFAVVGKIGFNSGHGKVGSVRVILNPIVEDFNKQDSIIRFGDLKAEVVSDKIVVTDSNKNEKFEYKFERDGKVATLNCTYSSGSALAGDVIMKGMIDAVYHMNHGNGSVFDLYDINNLTEITINDGLTYKKGSTETKVSINVGTNLTDNIKGKIPTIKQNSYIKGEDLLNLMSSLKTSKSFLIKKYDITVYVIDSSPVFYEIYTQIDPENEENILKSLTSVVRVINEDAYNEMVDENGNPNMRIDSNKYKVIANAIFTDSSIFPSTNNIYEIILYK